MLIGRRSQFLLKQTRAKAKMYEYEVPESIHVEVDPNANELLISAIAAIGNIAGQVLNTQTPYRIVPQSKKKELEFASKYFDAFLDSKLEPKCPDYITLLGSIAYYFCDYVGSSMVMAKKLDAELIDVGCNGLENVLAFILQNNYGKTGVNLHDHCRGFYRRFLLKILHMHYMWSVPLKESDYSIFRELRNTAYSVGTPRDVLLADSLIAIMLIKFERSALKLMPEYSGLSVDNWYSMLNSARPIHELWPSQIRLGEEGIFSGKSGVIQMPTSAGKTTSVSLTIRSAFLSGRTSLALVIAPFRALCREIQDDLIKDFSDSRNVVVNELSDIFELEDFFELMSSVGVTCNLIMVMTPEKLQYLLRQDISFLKLTGLIIFDEADMFDDVSRGTQYELLLSTVKLNILESAQCLFLSASIPNASQINDWLTNGSGVVIADNSINATSRSVAIADWEYSQGKEYGYLYFINSENKEDLDFFVPRTIEIAPLKALSRETKTRYFPDVDFQLQKVKNNDIAIYLANKLIHNGAIAVFCGRKDSADKILQRILEIESRGFRITNFSQFCETNEITRISNLIKLNYGDDNIFYRASLKGLFAHHRGVSNGIRTAIEYAMQKNLIRFVVCTSTLAQGVNLPIKYLIISSIYQSKEQIKVRDFQNLIGRAGRAGKYTEGTIILSEMFVYSVHTKPRENWKWKTYINALDPNNSESCVSLFYEMLKTHTFNIFAGQIHYSYYNLALKKYLDPQNYRPLIQELESQIKSNAPAELEPFQTGLQHMEVSLSAVESYLLSFYSEEEDEDIVLLASNTLGYYLSCEDSRKKLIYLFQCINDYLKQNIPDIRKRKAVSRTLLGASELLSIEEWTMRRYEPMLSCSSSEELLNILIDLLIEHTTNKRIKALCDRDAALKIALLWIKGVSYNKILEELASSHYTIVRRHKNVAIELNDIIDICDEGFGYGSMLIINAVSEILNYNLDGCTNTTELLGILSNRMRYGLPNNASLIIYKNGFPDRVIALAIYDIIKNEPIRDENQFYHVVRHYRDRLINCIADFPEYYQKNLLDIIK